MKWVDFIEDIQGLLESLDYGNDKDSPTATIDAWTKRGNFSINLTSHSPKHISIAIKTNKEG